VIDAIHASPFRLWLFAFTVTQVVEAPIYRLALAPPHRLAKALGASALTHPVLWLVFPLFESSSYATSAAVAEACVVAVEALYLTALGVRRPWAWSLLANAASCGVGFAVYRALGWM